LAAVLRDLVIPQTEIKKEITGFVFMMLVNTRVYFSHKFASLHLPPYSYHPVMD
jgi:hypothetical protein